MRQSDAETRQSSSGRMSGRLDSAATVGKTLIREPVREAVREALEEERQLAEKEEGQARSTRTPDQTSLDMDEQSSRGSSRWRRVLGLSLGLGAAGLLVRRRKQLMEAVPVGNRSKTGSAAERSESVGVNTTVSDEVVEESSDDDDQTVRNQ